MSDPHLAGGCRFNSATLQSDQDIPPSNVHPHQLPLSLNDFMVGFGLNCVLVCVWLLVSAAAATCAFTVVVGEATSGPAQASTLLFNYFIFVVVFLCFCCGCNSIHCPSGTYSHPFTN